MPLILTGRRARMIKTGQISIFNMGDDADRQAGIVPSYTVLTLGPYATPTVTNTPHYAAPTVSFDNGSKKCLDSGNGLVTFLAGDTVYIQGGANHGLAYVIAAGGGANAAQMVFTTAPITEAAGAYITLCKQTSPSSECVFDNNTGLMWRRYTTSGAKVGPTSNGKLAWYDATLAFFLHPADANLSIDAATKILKITNGAGMINSIRPGNLLEQAGFTIPNNNRAGGYRADVVAVNGLDLDITLWTGYGVDGSQTGTTHNGTKIIDGLTDTSKLRKGMAVTGVNVGANNYIVSVDTPTQVTTFVNSTGTASNTMTFTTLATEAAGGSRSIKIVCCSIFAYVAAYNAVSGGGHNDWRPGGDLELVNLRDMEQPTAAPNAAAFPSWPTDNYIWSATTNPSYTSTAMVVTFVGGNISYNAKTISYYAALVRG